MATVVYMIVMAILLAIIAVAITFILYYKSKEHYFLVDPKMWCWNDYTCDGDTLRTCTADADGLGIPECIYGVESPAAKECSGTPGSTCVCPETEDECFAGCGAFDKSKCGSGGTAATAAASNLHLAMRSIRRREAGRQN